MQTLQKLPIGIQDFAFLRENKLLYVDKTKAIFDFIQEGKYMYFGRPRRFGKSLLCSTVKYLYEGKKELFEGLYLYDKIDWDTIARPVIHIDLSKVSFVDISLAEGLSLHMDEISQTLNFPLKTQDAQSKFNELIVGLARQGKSVVVIVDEYDKALTDVLGDDEKFEQHRNILRGFYGILKPNDRYLHQVILTGVSRYGKISVFSQLNNILDYSLFESYVALCGYTPDELAFYFKDHITETASKMRLDTDELVERLKSRYNGYSFDGVHQVYNPFSILSFFKIQQFKNFWFDTGTPSFLLKLLQEQKIKIHELENFTGSSLILDATDIEYQSPISLLFQTGYLTISKLEQDGIDLWYHLDFPNTEVKQALAQYLLVTYTAKGLDRVDAHITTPLRHALKQNDLNKFCEVLKSVYADVPYQIYLQKEAYYHTIFHVLMNALGFKTESEVQTNQGRIDTVVETDQHIFIFEFKLDESRNKPLPKSHKINTFNATKTSPCRFMPLGLAFLPNYEIFRIGW